MIKIIDNFFNKKDLAIVQDFALTKAFYTPCFFEGSKEKTKENHYGNRWELRHDPKLNNMFSRQAELKFKIKIKKIKKDSGIDHRNLDHFKPHTDQGSGSDLSLINILIMISGPAAVTNGTVFYHGPLNNCNLDMHVGFRENRAVMFPSQHVHSQHASKVPNLKRYTATLFIQDYEDV